MRCATDANGNRIHSGTTRCVPAPRTRCLNPLLPSPNRAMGTRAAGPVDRIAHSRADARAYRATDLPAHDRESVRISARAVIVCASARAHDSTSTRRCANGLVPTRARVHGCPQPPAPAHRRALPRRATHTPGPPPLCYRVLLLPHARRHDEPDIAGAYELGTTTVKTASDEACARTMAMTMTEVI